MKDGPLIANVAALIGDPARANILTALMDGRALTASELAEAAGVTLQTASGHLSKLSEAQLLKAEKQGRHRYFRLSDEDVAQVLEALMGLAQRTGQSASAPDRRTRLCVKRASATTIWPEKAAWRCLPLLPRRGS